MVIDDDAYSLKQKLFLVYLLLKKGSDTHFTLHTHTHRAQTLIHTNPRAQMEFHAAQGFAFFWPGRNGGIITHINQHLSLCVLLRTPTSQLTSTHTAKSLIYISGNSYRESIKAFARKN